MRYGLLLLVESGESTKADGRKRFHSIPIHKRLEKGSLRIHLTEKMFRFFHFAHSFAPLEWRNIKFSSKHHDHVEVRFRAFLVGRNDSSRGKQMKQLEMSFEHNRRQKCFAFSL